MRFGFLLATLSMCIASQEAQVIGPREALGGTGRPGDRETRRPGDQETGGPGALWGRKKTVNKKKTLLPRQVDIRLPISPQSPYRL